MSTILLILFGAFAVAQSQPQRILYVKVQNSSHLCLNDAVYTTCHTFDWYYGNFSFWCKASTKMLFEEGVHFLNVFISVSDCHNFTMSGIGSTSEIGGGLPQPSSQIKCRNEILNTSTGLYFTNSTNIHVRNLEFESCGGSPFLKSDYLKKVQLTSSLAFDSVHGVNLDQVVIRNASGYALLTNNLIGTNKIVNSAFLHARKHLLGKESGNARFWFVEDLTTNMIDSILILNSSWFMYGKNDKYSSAAGGLNVYISSSINIHVTLFNVTARGNSGTNGNIAVYLVDNGFSDGSSMVINKSHITDGRGKRGGGMRFSALHAQQDGASFTLHVHHILTVVDSVFHNNSVKKTGGAIYLAYYNNSTSQSYDGVLRQVNFSNCNFTSNSGNGAAMEIIQHHLSAKRAVSIFKTSIIDCKFDKNFKPVSVDGPILDLISVDITISNTTFTRSTASIMTLRNTYLTLHDNILFENNEAIIGGAIKLCDTSLIFGHPGTNVTFANNRAKKGGAIYIQQPCMDTSPLCFFQPFFPKGTSVKEFGKSMRITFNNNSAEIAGDAIYGGDLDHCSTIVPFTGSRSHGYLLFYEIIQNVFHWENQSGHSVMASNPRRACVCNRKDNYTCPNELNPIEVYPGEQFTLSMITVGQMYNSTSGTVNATLKDANTNHALQRLNSPETSSKCTNLTFAIKSKRKAALINFKAETSELATRYHIRPMKLHVKILQCPLGFTLSEASPYSCICNEQLSKYLRDYKEYAYSPVTCNITSQVISVPQRRLWFGCSDTKYKNDSTNCQSLIITPNCNYYCNHSADVINVPLSDLDSQCSPYHTGVMCGACKKGYSRVLGDILECRKDCTNTNLYVLLPFFLASGILLVIVIMALNLTVTEGTLNGLLVYTMVIQTHSSYFPAHLTKFDEVCWVFVSWINLSFGIKACFYEGMDGYQHTWILFMQIFYFLLIQVVIILLTRNFIFFARLFGRNVVKVLATVFFLLFSNSSFAIFTTMQYATVHDLTPNGTSSSRLVWYYDGNVPYLGLKHAPLFVVALLWLFVVIFSISSLFLIQCLQRQSRLRCCRWVTRMKPFYDA